MASIKRKVDYYKQRMRNKAALKRMSVKCSRYMISGLYHVEYEFGKTVLKKGAFSKQFSLRSLLRWLGFGVFRIKNSDPVAQCNMALSSPYENYKMFDEKNKIVYTVYTDAFWEKIESFCTQMRPFFRTEIVSVEPNSHALIENYLLNVKQVDLKKCFAYFCEECREYMTHLEIGKKTIAASEARATLDSAKLPAKVREYVNFIEGRIRDYDTRYPVIVCHNDVSVENILTVDNKDFSLIDYERCGENVFFFDFMGLIFNSAVFRKQPSLYNEYMRSELDERLEELFGICGVKYCANDKEHYLFLFLLFKVYMIYNSYPDLLSVYTNRVWDFFRENGYLK